MNINESINIKLFSRPCTFVIGATKSSLFPTDTSFPEIAFIGRSNVGKSSLLNAIVNRKDLARASNTPGRTRQINFFLLDNKYFLVDLPGYGYAKAPKTEKSSWGELVVDYLRHRKNLTKLYLLIDSRHGIKKIDNEYMGMLNECGVPYQIVLTKIDKISQQELQEKISSIENAFQDNPAMMHKVIACSSSKSKHISTIREDILISLGGEVATNT